MPLGDLDLVEDEVKVFSVEGQVPIWRLRAHG